MIRCAKIIQKMAGTINNVEIKESKLLIDAQLHNISAKKAFILVKYDYLCEMWQKFHK